MAKQERKALKELQKDRSLVIRKADKGNNTLMLTDKDYYFDILIMKHHFNASKC